ncbi:MAG: 2-oxo acid dehydrogenase subunit E2 [SAR202 cluster bacterium]|uniref:Dihydrolipoamide acetyltransferase component of pyruvate dehydrogenase complex n=1 Tax=hydrothermal vent metagenome TaxID=652676 RepID=A0A160VCY2_9ZZZZ|nr:2-oxo acid dehydrogenase subunit E2 [Dehalococcoidia bacterium]MQF91570.1 2-oxo acid dehydrogenase subunit E2 [SAR202 cluster bacterium]MCH2500052.1 2-oxo acid dehydrogenase subunit E2 [Dehalococcoidia bacterium]MQG14373.1 2-oxo acid dehydrogenase subunit E2 [SAR202 cluster bacterium]MQG45259.1 2-oxo acid dehydrogenase subunit E2 [SAR202 cluster bacterium]
MATSIVMPQMGYDMHEGKVVRWLKKEGEEVTRGEVIAEIETDKATVEYEAYTGGVMAKIVAEEGIAIPVGGLIAVMTAPGEAIPEDILTDAAIALAADSPAPAAAAVQALEGPISAAVAPADTEEVRASPLARRLAKERGFDLATITGTGPGGRITEADIPEQGAAVAPAALASSNGYIKASPLAKRLARERGIDLATLTGTGPGGRVIEADVPEHAVPAAAESVAPATLVSENVELSRMRQAIARVTSDSKRDAPHFYVALDVDMTKAMSFRRDLNDELDAENRVSVNDLIVKASAIAIGRHPKFNSFFRDDHLQMNAAINVGIAIALESGLIVPGVNGCESKSLVEIAAASRDLVSRANSGTLRNDEYSGTTFSVSNLGAFDIESFTAIIFPPHAAILAVGTVKEQPVVRDGELAIAQIMKATLSTDHRVADGAEAAQFLVEIKKLLQNPISLVIQ